ncbi:MAG: hypothetical protein ACI9N3_000164 [Colwellia sp.]
MLLIPIASYYSIERLALIYFSRTQQDHKLNGIGIIWLIEGADDQSLYFTIQNLNLEHIHFEKTPVAMPSHNYHIMVNKNHKQLIIPLGKQLKISKSKFLFFQQFPATQ